MLVFVAFFASVIVPKGTYGALRLDALATLLYVSNWHFVLVNSNYFNETATASPLIHTWSLAVEEQFYLIWPLVVLGVLHFTKSLRDALRAVLRGGRRLGHLRCTLLYNGGARHNRVYLGTDTRAQCLFIGCALAVGLVLLDPAVATRRAAWPGELWRPAGNAGSHALRARRVGGRGRRHRHLGAHHVDLVLPVPGRLLPHRPGDGRRHPRGRRRPAQPRAALLVAGADPLRRPDLLRPLHLALADLHLAERRPHRPVGLRLFAVRALVTFAVSVVSYHLVEQPIREGTFLRQWRALVAVPVRRRRGADRHGGGHRRHHRRPPTGQRHHPGRVHRRHRVHVDHHVARPAPASAPPVRVLLFGDSVALDPRGRLWPTRPSRRSTTTSSPTTGILGCGVVTGPRSS